MIFFVDVSSIISLSILIKKNSFLRFKKFNRNQQIASIFKKSGPI